MARGNGKTRNNSSRNTTRESRQNKKQVGTVAIETIRQIVSILKPYELSNARRLQTYQAMMLDDAVGSAFSANCVLIEKAFSNAYVDFNEHSRESKKAADFLKWNLHNMNNQTIRSIARSAAEFKRDGLAPFEKMFRKGQDEWSDYWTIDKLAYYHPLTLDQDKPFTIVDGGRRIKDMRQKLTSLKNTTDGWQVNTEQFSNKGYLAIPFNKLAFCTYSATDAQPFGSSPFDSCYTAWREKVLLQDYTLVGVTKDFSGTPVLYLPGEILEEAEADPTSDAAMMVAQLKENMANMHTGDQNYTILPSDTLNENGSGSKAFEIKFLGVEGGGKAFDTEKLIEQRKKAIYNAFGAANLLAGEGGGGSYNLIEGQNTIHAHYVERDISVIEEMWNHNIIPQLFRLNEWKLKVDDIPKLRAGDIEPVSLDELGKFIQRVGSAGYLPMVPKVLNHIMKSGGIPYEVKESMTTEELQKILPASKTRASESGGTSGTGDSQSAQGGDNNSENTA